LETINTYYEDHAQLDHFIKDHHKLLTDGQKPVLVQVFSGLCEKEHLQGISRWIRSLLPRAQVLLTTTSGEIMDGRVSGLKTALSFSVFDSSDIRPVFAAKNGDDDYGLGQGVARQINGEKARVLILFATGMNIDASQMLQGIQSLQPQLPVAGGIAGANRTNARSLVGLNNEITDYGISGIVIESENLIVNRYSHLGWVPIGKEMKVTRALGSRVYTIDHIPAYQVYHQYLGISTASNVFKVVEFPLIISRHGINIARAPFLRFDDDSIGFFGDIAEGESVRFGFGHVEMILEQIDHLLRVPKRHPVETIFIYSCASRRGFLQEAAQIETRPLNSIAPTAGFFTSGEFFHNDGSNQLLNTTMTTLILSESAAARRPASVDNEIIGSRSEPVLPTDNVADRSLEILKALTCLVEKVTTELNQRTNELQEMNRQIHYASTHDALTGLFNRSYFNQALQEMEGLSPGVIMCDVDGLKFINDSFGHSQGDTIIRATAGILCSLPPPDSIVARLGGDEFAVVLPHTSRKELEQLCQAIQRQVADYNCHNPAMPLSISLGFACHDGEAVDINALVTEADNKMYWEKLNHRQNTNSDMVRALLRNLEERDIVTEEHGGNLQRMFAALEMERDFPQCNLTYLFTFARFHDIGKIGIANEIIAEKASITPEEKLELQRHCEIGYRIARSVSELQPIADWILKHHEWWNGEGYPLGLQGEEIPLECRMLAILDAYDDMTTRQGMKGEAALQEIERCAGTQFDPYLAAEFVRKMSILYDK